MEIKGKATSELRNKTFLCDVAFLCDITSHLNALNLQLQGRGHIITDMYATGRAFKTKLCLWETQILQENLSHFPHCQTMKEKVAAAVFPTRQFTEKLDILGADFIRRFAYFEAQKSRFELLSNPFAADVESAPSKLQMELIELQCSDTLKAKYESVGAAVCTFHSRHNAPSTSEHHRAANGALTEFRFLMQFNICILFSCYYSTFDFSLK